MFDRQKFSRVATSTLALIGTIAMMVPLLACEESGDRAADENQQVSGRQDRGRNPGSYVAGWGAGEGTDGTSGLHGSTPNKSVWTYLLDYSDLILTPDGQHVLISLPLPGPNEGYLNPGLALTAVPIDGGSPIIFPGLTDLQRINFSPDGHIAWCLKSDGRTVVSLDLQNMVQIGFAHQFPVKASALDVSPDGRFVIGTTIPTTDLAEQWSTDTTCSSPAECTISIVDTVTGSVVSHVTASPIRDLDYSPVGDELLLTHFRWEFDAPVATLTFLDPASGVAETNLEFPNCADELVVTPAGLALLGPLRCRRDPISVIDLTNRTFIENLPGFGPVSVSEDGTRAVGFTRKAPMMNDWGIFQEQAVGLIVIELPSLEWKLIEYGASEPAYLLSPDGQWIYTYEDRIACTTTSTSDQSRWQTDCAEAPANLTRWRAADGQPTLVSDGDWRLSHFAASPDKSVLYVVDNGSLGRLPMGSANIQPMGSDGFAPSLVNINSAGDTLVLGHRNDTQLLVLPLASGTAPLLLAPEIE